MTSNLPVSQKVCLCTVIMHVSILAPTVVLYSQADTQNFSYQCIIEGLATPLAANRLGDGNIECIVTSNNDVR